MDERRARAEGWLRQPGGTVGEIEPEWWLRMMCGQLAEEAAFTQPQPAGQHVFTHLRQLARIFGRRNATP